MILKPEEIEERRRRSMYTEVIPPQYHVSSNAYYGYSSHMNTSPIRITLLQNDEENNNHELHIFNHRQTKRNFQASDDSDNDTDTSTNSSHMLVKRRRYDDYSDQYSNYPYQNQYSPTPMLELENEFPQEIHNIEHFEIPLLPPPPPSESDEEFQEPPRIFLQPAEYRFHQDTITNQPKNCHLYNNSLTRYKTTLECDIVANDTEDVSKPLNLKPKDDQESNEFVPLLMIVKDFNVANDFKVDDETLFAQLHGGSLHHHEI